MARLERILIAANRGMALHDVAQVEAVAGRGLEGDRYARGAGTFSGRSAVAAGAREVSIVEARAVTRCNQRLGRSFDAADLRRNLVISGLDLEALIRDELLIGDVRLRITGRCPPCRYLSRLLGVDARAGLHGIAGVRAAIVQGGMLCRHACVTAKAGSGGLP